MWKKNYCKGVLERAGRVTVNMPIFFFFALDLHVQERYMNFLKVIVFPFLHI